jgi:GT2 family glycosyltransferase
MTRISVVVPVKNSQRTIGAALAGVQAQAVAADIEVILVGDVRDHTWDALTLTGEESARRYELRIMEVDADTGGRDSNLKRNLGLQAATGDVLCLTDSDMVLPPGWLATGLTLLAGGNDCAGGPMISVHKDFWGRYVDDNPVASKTPRIQRDYVVDRATIGRRGCKLPITANVLFTRDVYATVGGLDPRFVHSYEDYEFFQRIVDAGFRVLCTASLAAEHFHRQGWRALVREYHRSGRGCADFVGKHPHSPFSRDRRLQAELVTTAAVFVPVIAAVDPIALLAPTAVIPALAAYTLAKARSPDAIAFPAVTFVLGLSFTTGLLRGLRRRPAHPAVRPQEEHSWSPAS